MPYLTAKPLELFKKNRPWNLAIGLFATEEPIKPIGMAECDSPSGSSVVDCHCPCRDARTGPRIVVRLHLRLGAIRVRLVTAVSQCLSHCQFGIVV